MCIIGTSFIGTSSLTISALDLTKLPIKFLSLILDWPRDTSREMESTFLTEKERI